jgi:hypothetical protein
MPEALSGIVTNSDQRSAPNREPNCRLRKSISLRVLKEQEAEFDALRAALIEGERSGVLPPFDFDEVLASKRGREPKQL